MPANTNGIIVPAYFYPGGDHQKYWDRLKVAASLLREKLIVIANPSNGPGQGTSTDTNYVREVNALRNLGCKVIGYVFTCYNNPSPPPPDHNLCPRTSDSIRADIKKWLLVYNADGIFFDEVSSTPQNIPFYQDLYDWAIGYKSDAIVVNNFGTVPDSNYLSIGQSILCIYENSDRYNEFLDLSWDNSQNWILNAPPNRFLTLLYDQYVNSSIEKLIDHINQADRLNFGWIYLTDDAGNPWDRLPNYFEALVNYLVTDSFVNFNKVPLFGNVGLGTINPESMLDIKGPIKLPNSGPLIYSGNPDGVPNSDGFRIKYDANHFGQNLDALVIEKTDVNQRHPDGGISFINTGSDGVEHIALAIRGDGKIGIGTKNPNSQLEVNGAIKLPNSGPLIYNGNPDGVPNSDGFRIKYDANHFGQNLDALVIEKTDVNQRNPDGGISFINTGSDGVEHIAMSIRGNGNVGIGTKNPNSRLEVNGAIKLPNSGTLIYNGNPDGTPNSDGFRIKYNANYFGTNLDAFVIEKTDVNQRNPDGGIAFVNTGNDGVERESLVIRGNGNVGIGTNNPQEKLHVNGIGKFFRIEVDEIKIGNFYFKRASDRSDSLNIAYSRDGIHFQEVFRVENDGDVIGLTEFFGNNPTGRLRTYTQQP